VQRLREALLVAAILLGRKPQKLFERLGVQRDLDDLLPAAVEAHERAQDAANP
jgi:hypothetical protein